MLKSMQARGQYRWLIILLLALAVAIPAVRVAGAEPLGEREREREIFRQGWAAAGRGDQTGLLMAIGALPDYPLVPYLEYELLRQRLDKVPTAVLVHFLARYPDWSFTAALELAWLRSLGRRGEDEALLRYGPDSADPEVRCHLARVRIARQEYDGLEDEIEFLWLTGRSAPEACDPAFAWWRRRGNPEPEVAWQRFELVLAAGDDGLARYLRRYLATGRQEEAERGLRMRAQPRDTLSRAARWEDNQSSRQLISHGIRQLAGRDWEAAWQHWRRLESRFGWSATERGGIERELALYRAVALDPGAVAAIDDLPGAARDQPLLEWRARAAMAREDWPAVLASIEAMAADQRARSRWRYWRGRALAAIEPPAALVVWRALSNETDYYGFLASARLGQAFNLCSEGLVVDSAVQLGLLDDVELERALELFQVRLHDHARRTWTRVARRLSPAEIEQAVLLLSRHGWYNPAIVALNNSRGRQAYPWRFPLAERELVMAEAERRKVNPALVYGLMRAESAMQADARSPAGARGLLQLMPSTAREVARRNGIDYGGVGELMDPATNIALGVAHLAELQERFDGNWLLVAAGYNAGINAVTRWLAQRPYIAPDIWLETLPYRETREYVPRILAFATIYEWQLGQPAGVLAANSLGRQADPGRFTCSD